MGAWLAYGLALAGRKPQESPEVGDHHELKRASPESLAGATNEAFDILSFQGAETPRVSLVTDMRQQCSRRLAMARDRGARQPTTCSK